jgi:site-specific DNA recombinase
MTTNCHPNVQQSQKIETRVEDLYSLPDNYLTEQEADDMRVYLSAEIKRITSTSTDEQHRIKTKIRTLEDQRRKLLQAHYAGAIPLDLLSSERTRISRELEHLNSTLNEAATSTEQLTDH